jgi:hypothetical protein
MNFARNFHEPKLRVWQKLPKLIPKILLNGNRRIFRSFGQKWITVYKSAVKNTKIPVVLLIFTVIHFRPKLRKILRFPLNRNFGLSFGSFCQTRSFGPWKSRAKFMTRSFGCWFRIESVKKLILFSARLVELWIFFRLFWAVVGLNPGSFGSKSTPETTEPSGQLIWKKKSRN